MLSTVARIQILAKISRGICGSDSPSCNLCISLFVSMIINLDSCNSNDENLSKNGFVSKFSPSSRVAEGLNGGQAENLICNDSWRIISVMCTEDEHT